MKIVTGNRASSILYNWLLSNDIKGRVLIPCNICETVPSTYIKAGLDVSFADISLKDYEMDESEMLSFCNQYPEGIIHFNHTFGHVDKNKYNLLADIQNKYHVRIVDDCCLCIPEFEVEENSPFDIRLYSTGHVKPVDIDTGGYAFIQDKYEYLINDFSFDPKSEEKFENHISRCRKDFEKVDEKILKGNWLNLDFNIPEKQYFLTLRQHKDKVIKHKKSLNNIYKSLPGSMPMEFNNWRYNLIVENQDECIKSLFEEGLFCSAHYMSLCNGYFCKKLTPNCDYLFKHVINLFNDFYYTEQQASRTVEILKGILQPI